MKEPGDVTVLLRRWNQGDREALDALIPHVYPHLRLIAASSLRHEAGNHTLQATALVNELYVKLVQQRRAAWDDRAHFYVFAAKAMRRILADHARAVKADKRGAGYTPLPLHEEIPWLDLNSPDLLDVNRALEELEAVDSRKVRLVELHYFLGCTVGESASLVGIGLATAERDLMLVRSWLRARLKSKAAAIQTAALT